MTHPIIIDAQAIYAAYSNGLLEQWQIDLRDEAKEARQEREDRLACERETTRG